MHIISGLDLGGAETSLYKLLTRMDGARNTAAVLSLTTSGVYGDRIAALGIPVEAMGLPSPLGFMRLVSRIRAYQPDLVQTWMYHADLLGGLAARFAGVPAVSWGIRNGKLDVHGSPWTTRVVVRTCAALSGYLPDRILVCAEDARREHVSLGFVGWKMEVIPNGFDLDRFRPSASARTQIRAELGLSPATFLVGLIGRYHPQKNHTGFLAAAAQLSHNTSSVHYLMAGWGVDSTNAALMADLHHHGLSGCVHLLGLRQDMPRLMASLDVLALASSSGEAFPNVLGEAMACGVPCVTTDVGDSADIVGDTGRVVPVGDMAGLASALAALLDMDAGVREALGERARARVADRYELGQVVRRYEQYFASMARVGG